MKKTFSLIVTNHITIYLNLLFSRHFVLILLSKTPFALNQLILFHRKLSIKKLIQRYKNV